MNKKIATIFSSIILFAMPIVMLADINPGAAPNQQNITITDIINKILNFVWPLFVGFAVIMFIVAGFNFLTAQGDASKVGAARQAVLWGVVGVVVGILAVSLPFIIRSTLGF